MLPDNISSYGYLVDRVIKIVFAGALIITVLAFAVVVFMLIRFNYRKNQRASPDVGGAKKLMYLVIFIIVFDLVIALFSGKAWSTIFLKSREELIAKSGGDYTEVSVIGRQFFWSFVYPGVDKTFNTNDDFTTGNLMVVPQGTLVIIHLTSGDVIHSFFCPNLRFKYDAVPGRKFVGWFIAEKAGDYEIACAELCGPEHYRMRGILRVLPKQEYEKWLAGRSYGSN